MDKLFQTFPDNGVVSRFSTNARKSPTLGNMRDRVFRFNFNAVGEVMTITNFELLEYSKQIGLNDVAEERFSWLFALDVLMVEKIYGVEPSQIVSEIKAMEEGKSGVLTKDPTQFNRPPLKEFWHKHYFASRFLPQNILAELPKKKMRQLAEDVFDPTISDVVTEEMIRKFSYRVTIESFEERCADKRITGEWIVFAKHSRKNYYLCLATHNDGDDVVAQKIKDICCPQFPFLHGYIMGYS
jgi:hypothetical protein